MRGACVSLAGGLDCSNCDVSGDLLDASAMSSLAGQTWIALLPADTANCLLPHQRLVEKLQRGGASGLSNPLRKAGGTGQGTGEGWASTSLWLYSGQALLGRIVSVAV